MLSTHRRHTREVILALAIVLGLVLVSGLFTSEVSHATGPEDEGTFFYASLSEREMSQYEADTVDADVVRPYVGMVQIHDAGRLSS